MSFTEAMGFKVKTNQLEFLDYLNRSMLQTIKRRRLLVLEIRGNAQLSTSLVNLAAGLRESGNVAIYFSALRS